ncbi:MAG: type III-A CRISPR-associated RAMP protein Csm3 [Candidatus Methanomethylicaceae archaeon]
MAGRKLIGKIICSGELTCLTGLHIGASKETVEIGSLDSPVVRDPLTKEPYIPGSSLKGKLRCLLEKATGVPLNRNGGTAQNPIWRHECETADRTKTSEGAENCSVCRLFGSTGSGQGSRNYPARVKVRDLLLKNKDELEKIDTGLYLTEWKFENGIDRITSAANPRNLERVPRGSKFSLSIVYDVEDSETLCEDLKNLNLAIRLLEDDSLGGHGSRGYGQVKLDITSIQARKIGYYKGVAKEAKELTGLNDENLKELKEFFSTNGDQV